MHTCKIYLAEPGLFLHYSAPRKINYYTAAPWLLVAGDVTTLCHINTSHRRNTTNHNHYTTRIIHFRFIKPGLGNEPVLLLSQTHVQETGGSSPTTHHTIMPFIDFEDTQNQSLMITL